MGDNTSLEVAEWTPAQIRVWEKLGLIVQELQKTISNTDRRQPTAYIDPEVVLSSPLYMSEEEFSAVPDSAIVTIDYSEGFPTIAGLPFWERLDGEPIPMYQLFKHFRNQKVTRGVRGIAKVAADMNVSERAVAAIAKAYHWYPRAASYDTYQSVEREALRALHIHDMENKHRVAAKNMFDKCVKFFEGNHASMSPKVALAWFETAIKLERMSVGLSPDKPAADNGSSQNTFVFTGGGSTPSFNDTQLQQIAEILEKAGALDVQSQDVEGDTGVS